MLILNAAKTASGSLPARAKRNNRTSKPKLKRASKLPPSPPTQTRPYDYRATELECPHFQECSGCTLDCALASPPLLHQATAFFSELNYPNFQLYSGPVHGWRHRARLAVRTGRDGQPVVGLFKAGTHESVDIPACTVHHPALNAAADLVRECISSSRVMPYDESSGMGQLRYVQLALVEESSQPSTPGIRQTAAEGDTFESFPPLYSVQIVLVWNSEDLAASQGLTEFAAELWHRGKGRKGAIARRPHAEHAQVHSIHANFQPVRNNIILGPNTVCIHGSTEAWAVFKVNCGVNRMRKSSLTVESSSHFDGNDAQQQEGTSIPVSIAFDPASFMQANPGAMTHAIESIAQWIPPGARVVDLHAGVGTIGLTLAAMQHLKSLRAVEINPSAEQAFWKSWNKLKESREKGVISHIDWPELPREVEYFVAAAGSDPERWLEEADVAIVDPPRKGLEPELLQYFCCSTGDSTDPTVLPKIPQRLIYLSCGWPAFERDCRVLLADGAWELKSAEAFLFFPGANHIETLAVFDRTRWVY